LTGEDFNTFRMEARIIAHLIHPNIVRVLEFGMEDKTPFLVMDFAPHGTLRQRHPKGTSLPLPTVISYVKQVADALQSAHDERLVHRDVKPENMLLGRHNEVLLSDFGIAILAQSSHQQRPSDTSGTTAYMAPEQFRGKPCPASDQYSLGIVVYEWLCGMYPFQGSTAIQLAMRHLFDPPHPLRDIIPSISPAVEQVVMRALAKEPKERFGSMRDFAAALERASFLDELSAEAYPLLQTGQPPSLLTAASPPDDSLSTLPASSADDSQPMLD